MIIITKTKDLVLDLPVFHAFCRSVFKFFNHIAVSTSEGHSPTALVFLRAVFPEIISILQSSFVQLFHVFVEES